LVSVHCDESTEYRLVSPLNLIDCMLKFMLHIYLNLVSCLRCFSSAAIILFFFGGGGEEKNAVNFKLVASILLSDMDLNIGRMHNSGR